ncbi:MAG: adenylate/guanylate cyclase domain-containing protein [Myxococcaceae bacterium]
MNGTGTFTQLHADREYARARVVAEASLEGERVVAKVRLVMVTLMGASTLVVPLLAGPKYAPEPIRAAPAMSYLAFTLAIIFVLRRVQPLPRRAFLIPFWFIALDFGYVLAQEVIGARYGMPGRPDVAAAVLAVLICYSVVRFSAAHVVTSTAAAIGVFAVSSRLNGSFEVVWFSFVCACYLSLGGLIVWLNLHLKRMFVDVRRHERLSDLLPRQVVDRVLAAGGAPLEPVQREVTILFSDIRGFTALSETLPPRQVLDLLDEYFAAMSQIVKGRDGMVNKFIGDGLLAVWGVPDQRADHAELALKAALDMRKRLAELNEGWVREGRVPLRIGIGVHSGVVAAGMLGGTELSEYAVIGDAVNLASRIEGLTKTLGVDLLVSERAWQLGGKALSGQRVGEEKVKGRVEAVVVYAVQEQVAA